MKAMDMLQAGNIKICKYNINYLKAGNGAHSVLLMPGSLGNIWTNFKPQIEGFDREKFSLILWDPPGQGESRPPKKNSPTYYYHQSADTAFKFMKALNIQKFSLMGWCHGAVSSMILAAKHPEAIRKLVVWGARSYITRQELQVYINSKDLNRWPEKIRDPMTELYGAERLIKLWTELVETQEVVCNSGDGNLCKEFLSDIRCPTFLIYGEKDPSIDKHQVSYLHSNIRGSKIHLYTEGKHHIHLRYAEDFNRRVQEFLLDD